jgi:cysteinyl-tRNA synthetase
MNIYNTQTKQKEEFRPIKKGFIGIYTCGPTVYDYSHLGHAKGYVSMDFMRRYFEWQKFKVKYVQNFTDVGHLTDDADQGEDKIEKRAKKEKVDPWKLVEKYIKAYYKDFRTLNVKDPDFAPRPSEHVDDIISFIQGLIDKGFAYESDGSVYFDIEKFKDYGKLSGKRKDDLIAGARVTVRKEKKNPRDFALWIKSKPNHIMKWKSPWSIGYPGWHIECSVMSRKYLGDTFDIHGGGIENIFPHNESEIAQSEALTGKKMANYWVLWNMVNVDGEKMSKSKGNFVMVKDIIKKYNPMAVRLAIFKTHYRSQVDFSERSLQDSEKNIKTLHERIIALKKVKNINLLGTAKPIDVDKSIDFHKELFIKAMDDDFNTPLAFRHLFSFLSLLSDENLTNITVAQAKKLLNFFYDIDQVLGLGLKDVEEEEVPEDLRRLFSEYLKARKEKDWEKSDKLRQKISEMGWVAEDLKCESILRKK